MTMTDPQPRAPAASAPRAVAPILQAIAYGSHAPNPHNTQAWKVELLSDLEALLFIDERRLLPATDPLARQIHIGGGCFIETLAIGMSARGYETLVEYLPLGPHGFEEIGRKPVARIALAPNRAAGRDSLAEFIPLRQSNRKPYRGPLLSSDEATQIRSMSELQHSRLRIITRPEEMRPLLDIFRRAWKIEVTTRRLFEETRIWFRFNETQRQAKGDGLSMAQAGIDGPRRRLIEWSLRNGDPKRWFGPLSIRSSLSGYFKGIDTSKGLVLLTTETNEQLDWLKVGRDYARLALVVTSLGLTSHPLSQVLQEYPENAALQAEFDELLGIQAPAKVQMAVRVGRAERAYVARRRDPRDFLVGSSARTS
jgi:hypothetical protein